MAIAQDMRKYQAMTQAEAKALFFRMARLLNHIRKIDNEVDRKTIVIKEKAAEEKAPLQTEYEKLHQELTEYLKMHSERFVKPRKVNIKGVGSFGWETDAGKVSPIAGKEEDVKKFSDENGLALYSTEITVDKKAIAAAILDGMKVPGIDYTPAGDNPKISFSKAIEEENIPGE